MKKKGNKKVNKKGKGFLEDAWNVTKNIVTAPVKIPLSLGKSLLDDIRTGELHQPQFEFDPRKKDGLEFSQAQFSGPKSKLKQRLQKGVDINNLTNLDKQSLAHDIRYSMSNNFSDVQDADKKYIKESFSSINPNQWLSGTLIGAKYLVDKIHPTYSGKENVDEQTKKLYKETLSQLEKIGYGMKQKKNKIKQNKKNKK